MAISNAFEAAVTAKAVENRGLDFYTRALRLVKDQRVKDVVASLAADEKVHVQRFSALSDKLEVNADPLDMEKAGLLNAIAGDIAFSGGIYEAFKDGDFNSSSAVVKYAIKSEETSIAFYKGLKETLNLNTIDDIILQEESHLKKLNHLLKTLAEENK